MSPMYRVCLGRFILHMASLVRLVLLVGALDGGHAQLDEHGAELVPAQG